MRKKLYRSGYDKKLAGVCGGIGKYFDIDSTIVRLLWVFVTLWAGVGLIMYIICAFVIDKDPDEV